MDKELDELRSIWANGRESIKPESQLKDIIARAESKKRSVLFSHYGNIGILSMVMIIVAVSFYYYFPWHTVLSQWGVHMMVGGLAVRIAVEIFSIIKSKSINITDPAAKANEQALAFLRFRKRVHGPVTLVLVAAYMIGFLMFSPELATYVPLRYVLGLDGIFLVLALVLSLLIGKGIRQELRDLETVVTLKKSLSE